MADTLTEYSQPAAEEANKVFGDTASGRKLLSSDDLGTPLLRKFEETEVYRERSMTDFMTGVGNARAQEEFFQSDDKRQRALQNAVAERRQTGALYPYPASGLIIYMDTDGLKYANKKGRENGNDLLKMIAGACKEISQRENDMVFRQGGDGADEFAIILPGETSENVERLEIKFRQALKDRSTSQDINASLAFGTYGHGKTARETVLSLDAAINESKDKREIRGSHVDSIYLI